jgi:hypothetical protein
VTIAWKVGGSRQMHRSLLVLARYQLAGATIPQLKAGPDKNNALKQSSNRNQNRKSG